LKISFKDYLIEKWTESCLLLLKNKEAELLARISDLKRKGDEMILTCQISLKGVNSKNAYALRPSTKWDAKNVMSLTTLEREYQSLVNFNRIFLSSIVKKPSSNPTFTIKNEATIQNYIKNLKVNYPQACAIYNSVSKPNGFVLIQGPPGTGFLY
jgi:hypothetical protein